MTKNETAALRTVRKYRARVDEAESEAMRYLAKRYIRMTDEITVAFRKMLSADSPEPLHLRYTRGVRPLIAASFRSYRKEAEKTMTDLSKKTAHLGVRSVNESARAIIHDDTQDWKNISIAGLFTGKLFTASKDALNKLPGAILQKLDELASAAASSLDKGVDWIMSQLGDVLSGAWRGIQRIVRTAAEQIFRNAQQNQRQQTPVRNWRRVANHETACLACLLLEGTIYEREEDFSDHPNGRCFIVPCEPGAKPEQPGRQWLEEQDAETQKKIMGKGRWEAWQNGDLTLDQMTEVRPDPVYGPQPRVIPLKELGLTPAK